MHVRTRDDPKKARRFRKPCLPGGLLFGAGLGVLGAAHSACPGGEPSHLSAVLPVLILGGAMGTLLAWVLVEERPRSRGDAAAATRLPAGPAQRSVRAASGGGKAGDPPGARLRHAPEDAVLLHDLQGTILAWNRGAERMYGYGRETALGMNIRGMIPGAMRAEADRVVDRLMRGEHVEPFETRRIPRRGRAMAVRTSVTPVLDSAGRPAGVVIVERDLTACAEAEALHRSEQNLRRILDASPAAVCVHQCGRVVFTNAAYRNLMPPVLGIFQLMDFEFMHPDDVSAVRSFYEKLSSGAEQHAEVEFRLRPDKDSGGRRGMKWLHCRGTRVLYDGRAGLLFNLADITRIRNAPPPVNAHDGMASLGRVAAAVAHDMRSVLSSINLSLQELGTMCERHGGREKQTAVLAHIQAASDAVQRVVGTFNDLSRLRQPRWEAADIQENVEGAIALCAPALREKGIRIDRIAAPGLPPCWLDRAQIQGVLVNLIMNAADAVEDREAADRRVQVASSVRDGAVRVCVDDNGPGVPPDKREIIFDPFFSTKSETGIGLAVSLRIVRDHGGLLYVRESDLGGAEFVLELPARAAAAHA